MKILFMHPNMPGQYKHLCRAYADNPEHTVVFITKPKNFDIPGVHKVEYRMQREPSPQTHRYIVGIERGLLQGQEVWRMCKKLRDEEGFVPDVVCTHPGWGDALYIKDIFPHARVLSFFEFYYRSHGADVSFDPAEQADDDDAARVRTKNIINLLSLESADWGISPTVWQHSLHPLEFQPKISVLHDGIDTQMAKPDPSATLELNGHVFKAGDEVVTYIARNFEPYRGFPTFMRAAEIILRERPNCQIIAVGADEVSYGKRLGKDETWRRIMSQQVKLDESRIHWPGTVSYTNLIKLFQISAAHIYLTYPFVLSWSSMEAMACGCAMVGSRTQPVQEVMQHEQNALLADFFSAEDVAAQVIRILESPDKMNDMRRAARQTILDHYDIKDLLPLHMSLINDLAAGHVPPPTHPTMMARHAHVPNGVLYDATQRFVA
ncbi:MAG: glycosyltransferase family 4 protein [Rickettsiales bacterium]|nr:glycosyltransferase family 4 protein [Rickettsiales bacterium]